MFDEQIGTLLDKYFSENCTPEEKRELEKLLAQDPESLKIFNEFKKINLMANVEWMNYAPNKVKAWKKINDNINQLEKRKKSLFGKATLIWRIAAVFLIFIAFYMFYTRLNFMHGIELGARVESGNNIIPVNLPDGSKVWLNKFSKIEYNSVEFTQYRRINLQGEAFFDVVKDSLHPFIVSSENIEVKVLGTSFILKSYSGDSLITLAVKSGRVAFYNKENSGISTFVPAGYKVIYNKKEMKLDDTTSKNENIFAWKTRRLVYENERLDIVLRELSNLYDKKIITEDRREGDIYITVTFDNLPLNESLEILRLMLNREIINTPEYVVIK